MTGTGSLLRFMLRRERARLPWWLLGATLLVLVQSLQSQNLYGSPEALARLSERPAPTEIRRILRTAREHIDAVVTRRRD